MNSIIKESVHRVYHKFNQFTKNGFYKIHKFFKKNNSSDTESSENISLEYDLDTLEYYSDISDDEYDSIYYNNTYRNGTFFETEDMYYDEGGNPFDSFNLANWDGDQQVGFRD